MSKPVSVSVQTRWWKVIFQRPSLWIGTVSTIVLFVFGVNVLEFDRVSFEFDLHEIGLFSIAFGFYILSGMLKAIRWRLLFAMRGQLYHWYAANILHAVFLSILPFKLGELAFGIYLYHKFKLNIARISVGWTLVRLIDLGSLAMLAGIGLCVSGQYQIGVGIFLASICFCTLFIYSKVLVNLIRRTCHISLLTRKISLSLRKAYHQLHPGFKIRIAGLSFAIRLIQSTFYLCLILAVLSEFDLGLEQLRVVGKLFIATVLHEIINVVLFFTAMVADLGSFELRWLAAISISAGLEVNYSIYDSIKMHIGYGIMLFFLAFISLPSLFMRRKAQLESNKVVTP